MPDVNDAITKASAEASAEYEKTVTEPAKTEPVKVEPAQTEPAKEEPVKAADASASDKTETNPLNLTAEDLEAIEADPLLRKAYKTVLRGFTAKTTTLAAERKAIEEDRKVVEWFRADPDNALKTMARMRGFDLGEPKSDTAKAVDAVQDTMVKAFGPEGAVALRPVFEQIVDHIVSQKIEPQRQEVEQLKEVAVEAGIENTVQAFIAELHSADEDYDEDIQQEMADLANKVRKADDVSIKDHLRLLYNSVMHTRTAKSRVSGDLQRLKDARKKSEPVQGTRPAAPTERRITADMSLNDKVALAVELAQQER